MLAGMPDEKQWSRRLRVLISLWAMVSAMIGPLLGGYRFLSSRGSLPAASGDVGVLTIAVNLCIMTFGLSVLGLVLGGLFAFCAMRQDRLWKTIVQAILLMLMGLGLIVGTGTDKYMRLAGVVLLVDLLCLATPLSGWVEKRFGEVATGIGILVVGNVLFRPDWMKDWWMGFSKRNEFELIPLSEMRFEWIGAVLGASIYVMAYVAFQQWRTEGKWLNDIKDRFRGKT
jgi:hypothetical protein